MNYNKLEIITFAFIILSIISCNSINKLEEYKPVSNANYLKKIPVKFKKYSSDIYFFDTSSYYPFIQSSCLNQKYIPLITDSLIGNKISLYNGKCNYDYQLKILDFVKTSYFKKNEVKYLKNFKLLNIKTGIQLNNFDEQSIYIMFNNSVIKYYKKVLKDILKYAKANNIKVKFVITDLIKVY